MRSVRPPELEPARALEEDEDEEEEQVLLKRRVGGAGTEGVHAGAGEGSFSRLVARESDETSASTGTARRVEPPADETGADEHPAAEALASAPGELRRTLAAALDGDPSLAVRLRGRSAQVALETDYGQLRVRVRVGDAGAEVQISGPAAAAAASKRSELDAALGKQGLALRTVTLDGECGRIEDAETSRRDDRPPTERRRRPARFKR